MTRRDTILAAGLVALGLNSLFLGGSSGRRALLLRQRGPARRPRAGGVGAPRSPCGAARWSALPGAGRAAAWAGGLGALLGVALLVTGTTRPFRPSSTPTSARWPWGPLLTLAALRQRSWLAAPRGAPALGRGRGDPDSPGPRGPLAGRRRPAGAPDREPGAAARSAWRARAQGPEGALLPLVGARRTSGASIPSNFFMTSRDLRRAATRTSTSSGTPRPTTSRRSTTSGTASRSSTCRTWSGRSRRSGAPAATTTRCSSTGRFDRPIKEQIDTPEAQAGLGCTSCHSIVHVKQHDGPGRLRRSSTRRCTTWR